MSDLIFIMQAKGWGMDLIRTIFFWLDKIVYTVFSWVMQLIFDIVKVSSDPALQNFYGDIQRNIYTILAIFMLFKVTISMLNYLVNPDAVTDKERGAGKLVSRIIITLVMLISFSTVFGILYRLQPLLLSALPRVVLGTEATTSDIGSQMANSGERIAFDVYHGVWFNNNQAGFPYENTFNSIGEHLNDGSSGEYIYEYYPLIGMVVGIVMTIIVVGICIDVAIRVFKLMILQVIAPIPIISYIDPKSSKDGAFSKWVKMVISVYLEIFIKMGIVYFVVLVINELITSGVIMDVASNLFGTTGGIRGGLVLVALIVGLLFFAKDAPKFIADALGVKMGENGSLFGGLGKIMAAGAIGAGAIGSAAAGARASYMADRENGKDFTFGRFLKNAGAGLVGGVAGVGAGASAALNAKDHHAKAAMDAMAKRNATALAAGAAGSTALGRAKSTLVGMFAGETSAAKKKRTIANLEAGNQALDAVVARADEEAVKSYDTRASLRKGSSTYVNYKSFAARMDAAKATGADSFEYTAYTKDSHGNWVETTQTISMVAAEENIGWIKKDNSNNYIEQVVAGTIQDARMPELINDAEAKSGYKIDSRNGIKDKQDEIANEIVKTKRENAKDEQNDRFSGSNN